MRILFVTPYVPSRVRVRPFALIRELAKQGHSVTLACLVQPAWEARYLEDVRGYCKTVHAFVIDRRNALFSVLASLPTRTPLSVAYCRSTALKQQVRKLAESRSFDLVHTEFIRAARATMDLEGLPKVYDAVDSLGLAYRRSVTAAYIPPIQRLIALMESLKMPAYEAEALRYFDRCMVSSPADQQFLKREGIQDTVVLPNGVDLDYFAYSPEKHQTNQIVFLGKMNYYVNVASVLWFYKKVLPLVRREMPEVRFEIVGRDPHARILDLRRDPAVKVTGEVLDVRPHLMEATLAICPMISGSGIQNKLLEAMAVGTPCVATPIAAQSLKVRDGYELLIGKNEQELSECVLKLLMDVSLGKILSSQARRYVERNHNWEVIGKGLEMNYRDLLNNEKRRDGQG